MGEEIVKGLHQVVSGLKWIWWVGMNKMFCPVPTRERKIENWTGDETGVGGSTHLCARLCVAIEHVQVGTLAD